MTERFTIKRSGQRALSFTGERIAEASTVADNASSYYSGETGIEHRAAVYRRPRGGYVLAFSLITYWQGQRDEHSAWTAPTLDTLAGIIETELPARIADELLEDLDAAEDLDADAPAVEGGQFCNS